MLVTLNKRAILLGRENKLRVDEHTTDSHGGNTKIFFRNLAQYQKSAKLDNNSLSRVGAEYA